MPDMQLSQTSYESPRFSARVTEGQAPRATIAVELDHLLVHAADGSPAQGREARDVLERVARGFEDGDLAAAVPFVERAGMRVSAPGQGRLTFAVGAFGNVECAEAAYLAFRDLIDPALSELDLSLVALGAYPGTTAPSAALSLRVCVPQAPSGDLRALASALAPVLALLGDNTPRAAGAPRALVHASVAPAEDAEGAPALDLRCADALPIDFALAYVTLVKQILFRNKNRVVIGALLDDPSDADCAQAVEAVRAEGFAARLYGSTAGFWADELILLASNTARGAERAYLAPLSEMIANRFTLADAYEDPGARRPEAQEAVHAKADEMGAPRIGILPRYDFELSGLSLSRGYTKGVLAAGGFPVVLPLTDNPRILRKIVESCDGFIVPGGHDIAPETYGQRRSMHLGRTIAQRDAMELTLIPQILAAGKPLLGICRGMQALNVACGGTLWQDVGDAFPPFADSPRPAEALHAPRASRAHRRGLAPGANHGRHRRGGEQHPPSGRRQARPGARRRRPGTRRRNRGRRDARAPLRGGRAVASGVPLAHPSGRRPPLRAARGGGRGPSRHRDGRALAEMPGAKRSCGQSPPGAPTARAAPRGSRAPACHTCKNFTFTSPTISRLWE